MKGRSMVEGTPWKHILRFAFPVLFEDADVVVFASPLYFWTITGTLKTAADRLYAELECLGYGKFPKKSVLLMTADGGGMSGPCCQKDGM